MGDELRYARIPITSLLLEGLPPWLANPIAGVKVRGTGRSTVLDVSHAFPDGEWMLVRTQSLTGSSGHMGGDVPAAQRVRAGARSHPPYSALL
jgi:hypothetical protein